MSKNLRLYNVGWGDCLIAYDDNWGLLIDCGSAAAPKSLKNNWKHIKQGVINDIDAELAQRPNAYAAISHIHNDHYSILHHLANNSLDAVLLPNYFTKQDFDITLFDLMTTPYKSPRNTIAYWMIETILMLLRPHQPTPLKQNGAIHFLSSPTITQSLPQALRGTMHVVHPVRIPHLANALSRLLAEVDDFFNSNPAASSFRNDIEDNLASLASLATLPDLFSNSNAPSLSDWPTIFASQVDAGAVSRLDQALQSLSTPNTTGIALPKITKSMLKQNQHRYSLGFGIAHSKYTGLFLDDIDKNDYEKTVAPQLGGLTPPLNFQKVTYLKAPHHGTENHFSPQLPHADITIVSNCKRNGYKPTSSQYYANRSSRMACTNNDNCGLINNGSKKCASALVCGIPATQLFVDL